MDRIFRKTIKTGGINMSEKLTNIQVGEFLRDFEKNSETTILEEGKEKDELTKIAEARGIKIKGSRDLSVFKTIYAFTDQPNSNGAILPKAELLRVLPQIVGKPININHERRFVVGHYIDYRYKQKDSQINAYGIYYKSNFGKEFEEAKKLLKKKKLSSSFEIWSPKDKRKFKEDGSYELHQMEIAGGALIYEDKNNEPSFKDAKVLAIGKVAEDSNLELVYASKYKEDEIITCKGDKCKLEKAQETLSPKETPTIAKIKCSNCGEEFDSGVIDKIKCPKCFAILDKSGNMIYPPQIIDFKMLCPNCSTNNWLLLSKKEDKVKVRCSGCSKEYNLAFATEQKKDIIDKINFVYSSKVSCLQCHKPIYVLGTSSLKTKNVKCKKCGLEFSYDITHDRYKKIAKIEEAIPKENKIDKTKESSEEGGQKMAKEKKVEKTSEKKEDKVIKEFAEGFGKLVEKEMEKSKEKIEKEVKETPSTTEKAEEPKVEEKAEVKVEEKVEDKKEKLEAKEEKLDEKLEAKVEVKEEIPKAEDAKVELKIEKEEIKVEEKKVEATKKEAPKEEKIEVKKVDKTDKYIAGIRKIAKKVKELKKEKASLEKKVELYKNKAKTILERQVELGESCELTEEEILNDDKFGKAKAEKELAKAKAELNKGNNIVGAKTIVRDEKWYADRRKAIDKEAFKHINKSKK